MAFAIGGALIGPVVGGLASVAGRAAVFGGVAGLALLLAVLALRLPAPPQGESQPLRLLLTALRSRRVLGGMWLLVVPAMLFGTLGVLAPLRLDQLGWGTFGVAATFFVSAGLEALLSPAVGRWSDRRGRLAPIRAGLLGAAVVSLVLPWIGERWTLSVVVVLAGLAYGVFWAPATALLSEGWENAGVAHALGFTLMNFAWAPGHVVGATVGGGLADIAGDVASYALLAALCVVTFSAIGGRAWRRSAPPERRIAETG